MQPLANGLTNLNYRVDVDTEAFVVRIPGASSDLLLIDREAERHNTVAAAGSGIGPRVVRSLPGCGVTVFEFIHGRTLTNADLQAAGMPARIVRSLHRLHAGARFANDFDMLGLADRYLGVMASRGIAAPPGYRERQPTVERIREALAAHRPPAVPCHNDLLADNYIDDGRLLRFVDYEYSGNGDPAFELGNLSVELEYDAARIGELVAAYHGAATPHRLARVRLSMIVSDVGWTLWAAIQAATATIPFDYVTYGGARWRRAEAAMDSPDLAGWLRAARHPDGSDAP